MCATEQKTPAWLPPVGTFVQLKYAPWNKWGALLNVYKVMSYTPAKLLPLQSDYTAGWVHCEHWFYSNMGFCASPDVLLSQRVDNNAYESWECRMPLNALACPQNCPPGYMLCTIVPGEGEDGRDVIRVVCGHCKTPAVRLDLSRKEIFADATS